MAESSSTRKFVLYILLTGFLAGTLDGLAAVLMYWLRTGKNPVMVFEFIASGIYGRDAFSGEPDMQIQGLIFHYIIATGWTAIFFILYPRVERMQENILASAVGYGACIWLLMNLVVLPLSRVPTVPFSISSAVLGMIVLMVCVGLPISYMSHRYYSK